MPAGHEPQDSFTQGRRRDRTNRTVAMLATLGVVTSLTLTVLWILRGDEPKPPFLDARTSQPPVAPARDRDVLELAGSGSNLPITRALAAAYAQRVDRRPLVHASIGSGGGIRALLDGAIDIALISRPLRPEEASEGLVATPYARLPVIVAVHADVPVDALRHEELLDIYAGRRTTWPDGSPIVVLQREPGDSSHAAVARVFPEFRTINDEAYRRRVFRVLYHDTTMREALASTAGAIGLHGSGVIWRSDAFRAVTSDGIDPTSENLTSGAYPFYKELAFVTRGAPEGEAAELIAFVHSDEGRSIVESYGAIALPEAGA